MCFLSQGPSQIKHNLGKISICIQNTCKYTARCAEKQKLTFLDIFLILFIYFEEKLVNKGFHLPINQQTPFGKYYIVEITMFKQQTI